MIKPKPTHVNDFIPKGNKDIVVHSFNVGKFHDEKGRLVYRDAAGVVHKGGGALTPEVLMYKICSNKVNFACMYGLN